MVLCIAWPRLHLRLTTLEFWSGCTVSTFSIDPVPPAHYASEAAGRAGDRIPANERPGARQAVFGDASLSERNLAGGRWEMQAWVRPPPAHAPGACATPSVALGSWLGRWRARCLASSDQTCLVAQAARTRAAAPPGGCRYRRRAAGAAGGAAVRMLRADPEQRPLSQFA